MQIIRNPSLKFLQDKDIDIGLLNGTWLEDGQIFKTEKSKNSHNGVGVLINPNLKHPLIHTRFYEGISTAALNGGTENGIINSLCILPSLCRYKNE